LYNSNTNRRHVALIDTSYGVVLGFEDLFDLGDQDYNDGLISSFSFPTDFVITLLNIIHNTIQ